MISVGPSIERQPAQRRGPAILGLLVGPAADRVTDEGQHRLAIALGQHLSWHVATRPAAESHG
jgi:hypothetical protein